MNAPRLLLLCSLFALACDTPPVDPAEPLQSSHLDGQVVVQSHARGNAVVFLFDADHPPPPEGTGQPLSFTVIPSQTLFGAAAGDPTSDGPFVAPFTFSQVAPGRYLLRGFIDRDDCIGGGAGCHGSDFIPWYRVTREPNAGDVGGAAIDLGTGADTVFTIDAAHPAAVTGATVSFADSAQFPIDRPAFQVNGTPDFDPSAGEKTITLLPQPLAENGVYEPSPGFLASFVDTTGDGQPDVLYPLVVVRKLSEVGSPLADENDVDQNGVLDSTGVDYPHADGTEDGKPDAVVLAASIVPPAALLDSGGNPVLGTVPVSSFTVKIEPIALDAADPANPVPLESVPPGRYAVMLVGMTGQTWRVPNELAPDFAPAVGLPSVDSQAFQIVVP